MSLDEVMKELASLRAKHGNIPVLGESDDDGRICFREVSVEEAFLVRADDRQEPVVLVTW